MGSNSIDQYNTLLDVFNSKEIGLLYLPKIKPFYTYFSKLSMTGEAGPLSIFYSFQFISCNPNYSYSSYYLQSQNQTTPNIYTAKSGDSLYSIANKFNISIDDILSKNKSIASPFNLPKDQLVEL